MNPVTTMRACGLEQCCLGLPSPIPQRSPLKRHCTQPPIRSLDPAFCCDPVSCFQVSENFWIISKSFKTCSPSCKGKESAPFSPGWASPSLWCDPWAAGNSLWGCSGGLGGAVGTDCDQSPRLRDSRSIVMWVWGVEGSGDRSQPQLLQQQLAPPVSHSCLVRLSDQGGFHRFLHQAAPGQVRRGVPAGAHQPCRELVEDADPTVAPSPALTPLTGSPRPLASTLPAGPMTSISVASHSSLSTSWLAEPFLPPDGFSHQPLALPPSPPCLPPSEASPGPLKASLAPEQPDSPLTLPQCDSRAPPPCPIPQSPAPHTPWPADRSASPVPAILGLGRSRCPISALSWWQAPANAWNLSTSTCLESHQAPLSHGPPEALFWGDPTHRQEETSIPPSINPDVQKLLEILTAKRKELKFWREKEKKERSKYQLTSFGRTFKSPGDGQDTMGCPSFWSMSGKAKQLLSPDKPPRPKIPRDNLEQKCLQLFWGLPFLHSESLMATVRVTDPPLEFPSVIFNELSHALPLQIQGNVAPRLSLTHDLLDPLARPQSLTLRLSQSLPLPLAQPQPLPLTQPQPLPLDQPQLPPLTEPQTQASLAPSVPVGPSSLPLEMGSCEVSCPVAQKTWSYMSSAVQNLECHFLEKQLERGKLPPVVKRSQEVFSQGPPDLPQGGQAPEGHRSVSVLPGELIDSELCEQPDWHLWKRLMKQEMDPSCRVHLNIQPHQEFQKVPQAHSWHSPTSESESTDGSCQATQKTGSRYPGTTVPGKRLGKDSSSSAGRIWKDLHRGATGSPEKAPGRNREESDTDLKPSTSSAEKKRPEKDLRAHFRKLGQFREGQMPLDVQPSRLAAHHASDLPGKPSPHGNPGKPVLSKCWESSHDISILSPYAQRMLEAHIIRLRVKHRWGLPLKVLKTINLFKLKKGFLLSQSFPPRSATCVSKAGSGTKFLGNPPQPYQGEVMKESYPTWGGALSVPQPTCEEIQQALEGSSPGGGPLAGQGASPPSRTSTYGFVGRIWHSETPSRTLMNSNLESSPSPAMATKEPRRVNGGQASRDVTVLELNLEPQDLSAKEPGEVGEVKETPAWGVTLEPRVLANNQGLRGKGRRSGSSGKSDSPLQHTKLVVRDPEELCLEAWHRRSEPRKLMESENQPCDPTPTIFLQDCETGVLLQDCATESLLQDCQSNMFIAADILASQGSLSGFQSGSSEDTSTSQVLHGQRSHGQSPYRQPGHLGLQHQCKSPSRSRITPKERESSRRSPLRAPAKELSELKLLQISEVKHPVQSKESGEASGSKACEILLKKEEAPPESYFRRRMTHLFQWFFPSRGRGLENSLQKGKPSSSQGRRQVMGRSAMERASAEAQVVVRAVERILEEKMLPYQGLRVPEVGRCKKDLQASGDPNVSYHRVLSYQEQRRVMRETASPQGTPRGHNYANKTEWIGWPFPTRVPECPSRPCQNRSLVPGPSGRTLQAHCPRHCLLQRDISPGQPLRASHAFPGRTNFLQEKTQTMQRKSFFFSH
ncbi:spermatogenesis-associated protein 31E1-like isoform X2 [Lutra lutra]|uniref:spermatogenesis-associated protein 31E1-like isoform X2 n=1 Tax=Lutra lutra TaxID=9657 RepID=UPI001FD427CA|nr:spermatogenesis-associated protein 31E1-like isoform X2 [Lutra lutra]